MAESDVMISAESGREMRRGVKPMTIKVDGETFEYGQPGWWCSIDDPEDMDGQLIGEDNRVADMARATAKALRAGAEFPPALIRAIRVRCDLTQREAGEVFGTGDNSFDKYERGEIMPSNPTKKLLRLAMEHPELFAKPARGAIASPPPQNVALIKDTLREARLDKFYGPLLEKRRQGAL
jgi:HTH-type transcriptional regulator/antitoxin MqsA